MAPIPDHQERENRRKMIMPNIHLLTDEEKMTFIRTNSEKQRKVSRLIVRALCIVAIAFSIWVTLSLIPEGRYYPATGWGIISIVIFHPGIKVEVFD